MKKLLFALALTAATLFSSLFTAPAFAQATRTWVSGLGDDANPCSRTAPCKTFAGAISKTAASGEINCLDPGGFGALTITKSISILCDTGTAGVLVSGTNGITINAAATDIVILQGLDFDGVGTGLVGVNILQAKHVYIQNCTIRNFRSGTAAGIATSGAAIIGIGVYKTLINNNGTGIKLTGTGGAKAVDVFESVISGSLGNGIELTNSGSFAIVTNSIIQFNGANGVGVLDTGTGGLIDRTTFVSNLTAGINVTASGGSMNISASSFLGNPAAFAIASGGTINSSGDNKVAAGQGSTTPNGTLLKE